MCCSLPSLVMKEMNSETHSCMHSFASFAIFAFSGKADFIIRATGAKLRMLASDSRSIISRADREGVGVSGVNRCVSRTEEVVLVNSGGVAGEGVEAMTTFL